MKLQAVKITLRPCAQCLGDGEDFRIVKLVNAISVSALGRKKGVGDTLSKAEAEALLNDRKNEVAVIAATGR